MKQNIHALRRLGFALAVIALAFTTLITLVGCNTTDKPDECEHIDADCSGVCDLCEDAVAVSHKEIGADGRCSGCGTCLEHRDVNCDDICDNCSSSVTLGHTDADNNNLCDKCEACLGHTDALCDGKCDSCGETVEIAHSDTDNNNKCDKCGTEILPIIVSAKKTASVAEGCTVYPAYYVAWSNTTYRGAYVTYTITVTNHSAIAAAIEISDILSENATLISGCDTVVDGRLSWGVTVSAESEASISYTVAVSTLQTSGAYLEGGLATVNGKSVDCYDIMIAPTLNEIDATYIEKAVRILSTSSYEGLEFAKFAYTVAFTNAKAITELLEGTPSEVLALILSGSDEKLSLATSHGLVSTNRIGATVAAADLVPGDLIYVNDGTKIRLYIYTGSEAYNITEEISILETSTLISEITRSRDYAVVRPSITMTGFTPSDPDEKPVIMNAYQEAIVSTAEAYLMRGESLQYEDVYFGLVSQSGEYRWAYGEKTPEEYTSDEWGYVNCAVFTYEVYREGLGYTLPSKMYTTLNLTNSAATNGMSVFRFERTRADVYTEAEQIEIEAQFMATLEVGDIIVRRHTNASTGNTTGHAMLYVGNGRFIHSGGSSYSKTTAGTGYENYEPTIRCHKVHDYLFSGESTSMFNDEDNIITIVRPLNKFNGEIPEASINRTENMDDIRAEKLSSHPSSITVNPGDEITFTFSVFNVGNTERTVEIYDKIPTGTLYVSGGDTVNGDELRWTVTVGANETVKVSYTVKVDAVADGTLIDGWDGTVGGVMHRCAAIRVKRTLTASEQGAIIDAINAIKAEGTTLTHLALVNEIYKRALGIESIFADTNTDSVMRDGEESVFATSSKKTSNKYFSKLRSDETYYSGMLVDHLYGGMRFDSSEKLRDRTRLLKEQNLIVGDVLIGRTSSGVNVYIYAGDMGLLLLNSGVGDAADFTTVSERLLYYGRDFAVLRPSQQIEG